MFHAAELEAIHAEFRRTELRCSSFLEDYFYLSKQCQHIKATHDLLDTFPVIVSHL